jgi:hypothetical protein
LEVKTPLIDPILGIPSISVSDESDEAKYGDKWPQAINHYVQAKREKMELLQLQEVVPRLPGILPDVRAPLAELQGPKMEMEIRKQFPTRYESTSFLDN